MPVTAHSLGRAAFAFAAGAAALAVATTAGAQGPTRVPLDSSMTINGVEVACTGIGQTKHQDRWFAYPVRVEFADAKHDYMAGEVLSLSDEKGTHLLTVRCEGPWLLLKLPDMRPYRVEARLTEKDTGSQTATIRSPSRGQTRVVLTFAAGY